MLESRLVKSEKPDHFRKTKSHLKSFTWHLTLYLDPLRYAVGNDKKATFGGTNM